MNRLYYLAHPASCSAALTFSVHLVFFPPCIGISLGVFPAAAFRGSGGAFCLKLCTPHACALRVCMCVLDKQAWVCLAGFGGKNGQNCCRWIGENSNCSEAVCLVARTLLLAAIGLRSSYLRYSKLH
ncbi:uncharacterized protein K441DRAFT_144112 [Cenococcum geophilum 1.58]|uniref:uncharacterized protein n=1 Tax=Cenococcum geophilum 1.58 TaxID=794803 RepID=UPI00358FFEF9|nr:hypothetical protein K441DRAFT_144112 [Cenococcum geophilum 1.58]